MTRSTEILRSWRDRKKLARYKGIPDDSRRKSYEKGRTAEMTQEERWHDRETDVTKLSRRV